jgi:hypothetical protein
MNTLITRCIRLTPALKWQHGIWLGAADPRRDGNWVAGKPKPH